MFESKSFNRLVAEAISRITSTTNVESVEPGTVLRQLIDQSAMQIHEVQRFVQLLASATFLTEASGPFLDTIATLYGLKRRPAMTVQRIGGIRFYTEDGTQIGRYIDAIFFTSNDVTVYDRFGGRYSVEKVEIPRHVLSYPYVTVNQTPVEIQAEYLAKGDIYTFYPQIPGLRVTNTSDVHLIQPAETDEELRYRIQQHLNSYRCATSQQLRFQQLSVPGVQDQKVVEFPRGIGTVDVYILGIDVNTDEQLIEPVYEAVKDYVQAGIDLQVKVFSKTHIILGGLVRRQNQVANSTILDQIQTAQRSHIDRIPPGGVLNKHILLAEIVRSCPDVQTIDNFQVYTKYPHHVQVQVPLGIDSYYCHETEKLMLQPTDWQVFQIL